MMAGGRRLCTLNRVTQAIRERYFSVDKLSDRSFFFLYLVYPPTTADSGAALALGKGGASGRIKLFVRSVVGYAD